MQGERGVVPHLHQGVATTRGQHILPPGMILQREYEGVVGTMPNHGHIGRGTPKVEGLRQRQTGATHAHHTTYALCSARIHTPTDKTYKGYTRRVFTHRNAPADNAYKCLQTRPTNPPPSPQGVHDISFDCKPVHNPKNLFTRALGFEVFSLQDPPPRFGRPYLHCAIFKGGREVPGLVGVKLQVPNTVRPRRYGARAALRCSKVLQGTEKQRGHQHTMPNTHAHAPTKVGCNTHRFPVDTAPRA
jgi:hypothetical protein